MREDPRCDPPGLAPAALQRARAPPHPCSFSAVRHPRKRVTSGAVVGVFSGVAYSWPLYGDAVDAQAARASGVRA